MKKVIFVCIVSLAVCFVAGNAVPENSTATGQPVTPPQSEHDKKNLTPSSPKPTTSNSTTSNATAPTVPTSNGTSTPKPNDNKTITTTPVPTAQTTPKSDNITTEATVTNQTTTITPPPKSTTTMAPVVSTKATEPEPKLARGFDGASFTGGIILTLGLLALGFMGFKYYKNQTERNYHTL